MVKGSAIHPSPMLYRHPKLCWLPWAEVCGPGTGLSVSVETRMGPGIGSRLACGSIEPPHRRYRDPGDAGVPNHNIRTRTYLLCPEGRGGQPLGWILTMAGHYPPARYHFLMVSPYVSKVARWGRVTHWHLWVPLAIGVWMLMGGVVRVIGKRFLGTIPSKLPSKRGTERPCMVGIRRSSSNLWGGG